MKKNLKVMIGTVAATMTIKLFTLNAAAAGNDAAGKLKNAIDNTFGDLGELLKSVGQGIAGLITACTGIAALVILVWALWDSWKHDGVNNVWGNHSVKFFILLVVGIASFAGLVTAAFGFM